MTAVIIAAVTLWPGSRAVDSGSWCITCGTRAIADAIANIVLFAPLGCALAYRRFSPHAALIGSLAFSAGIEIAQLFVITGRHANLRDVITNAAGAIIGYYLLRTRPWRIARKLNTMASLSVAGAWSVLLIAVLLTFARNYSLPPYSVVWNPSYEGHRRYQGDVIASSVGDLGPQLQSPTPLSPPARVQEALKHWRFTVSVIVVPPRGGVSPIISVHDSIDNQVALIAAGNGDLIFRYWANADLLRLDHPDIRVAGVLRDVRPGDTAHIAIEQRRGSFCAVTNGVSHCTPNLSPGRTWNALVSPESLLANAWQAAFVWIAAGFFMIGFLARDARACGAGIVTATAILFFAPVIFGFGALRPEEFAGLVCGVVSGQLTGSMSTRYRRSRDASVARRPQPVA